jgi:hypothetical protein
MDLGTMSLPRSNALRSWIIWVIVSGGGLRTQTRVRSRQPWPAAPARAQALLARQRGLLFRGGRVWSQLQPKRWSREAGLCAARRSARYIRSRPTGRAMAAGAGRGRSLNSLTTLSCGSTCTSANATFSGLASPITWSSEMKATAAYLRKILFCEHRPRPLYAT